ncbi:MAG: ATP-binding protein [Planctomycetaceae bacterium]
MAAPVILMTAQGSEDIATEALRRGAASYVPKRKLSEDLIDTVERVLLAAREDRTHSRMMHYLTGCDLEFTLGNDWGLISSLVSFLQQALRCLPLGDETERLRVGLALEEALKNAYYHGSLEVGTGQGWPRRKAIEQIARERLSDEQYHNRRIHVCAGMTREQAVFVIRDEGPGFDASQLPAALDASADPGTAGRGLTLMRTIMDEVRFNATGNEVTLVKNCRRPDEDAGESHLAEG